VCGERAHLPYEAVEAALKLAPRAEPDDVERLVRCTLEDHSTGDHFAFVLELDGVHTGSVWARWIRGRLPAAVLVLPDCPATGPAPAREPCCEFAGHAGGHTWELTDPWAVRG